MQPSEHREERRKRLRQAHGDVEVPTVRNSICARLVRHVRPGLHQSPPLVRDWSDVVPKHAPGSIDRLLHIGPHHDAQGEVGEEEAKNDAGKALDGERGVERTARTKELVVVETFHNRHCSMGPDATKNPGLQKCLGDFEPRRFRV